MTDQAKHEPTPEVADKDLDQVSGGNNRNQLWGDYFYVDVAESTDTNKMVSNEDSEPQRG